MQRIGIDARLTAYRTGGIASYTESLTQSLAPVLAARAWDMFLYVARRYDADGSPALPGHQAILWTPPHHRFEQLTLPVELVRTRPTLFHSPDFIPPRYWPGRAVITVHDLDFILTPERLTEESRRYYGQIRWAVHRAEAIIAVSEATKADLVRLVSANPERIEVIPEAADAAFLLVFAPQLRIDVSALVEGRDKIVAVRTEPDGNSFDLANWSLMCLSAGCGVMAVLRPRD